jgi:hypothetical protein
MSYYHIDNPGEENPVPGSDEKKPKDPSVENGEKMIEVQKIIEQPSEEDKDEDADQWRNEG